MEGSSGGFVRQLRLKPPHTHLHILRRPLGGQGGGHVPHERRLVKAQPPARQPEAHHNA